MNSFSSMSPRRLRTGAVLAVAIGLLAIPGWRLVAQENTNAETPLALLNQVRDHYRAEKSFSMIIKHQDSSGLFPGAFSQSLQWQTGDRFELRITSEKNEKVPAYFAANGKVVAIYPDGTRDVQTVSPQPNNGPGWEVCGGAILGFLQDTDNSKFYFDPPKGIDVKWSFGALKEWKGKPVRELLCEVNHHDRGARKVLAAFYIERSSPVLVGYEWDFKAGKRGFALYEDQRAGVSLPANLGDIPAQ